MFRFGNVVEMCMQKKRLYSKEIPRFKIEWEMRLIWLLITNVEEITMSLYGYIYIKKGWLMYLQIKILEIS